MNYIVPHKEEMKVLVLQQELVVGQELHMIKEHVFIIIMERTIVAHQYYIQIIVIVVNHGLKQLQLQQYLQVFQQELQHGQYVEEKQEVMVEVIIKVIKILKMMEIRIFKNLKKKKKKKKIINLHLWIIKIKIKKKKKFLKNNLMNNLIINHLLLLKNNKVIQQQMNDQYLINILHF